MNTRHVNTSTALTSNDHMVFVDASGELDVALSDAVSANGKQFTIKRPSGTSFAPTITAIDGQPSVTLPAQHSVQRLVSNDSSARGAARRADRTGPAPVVVPEPAPPAPVPAVPLVINDSREVTVTLKGSVLTITRSPDVNGVWLRLLVDGAVTKGTGGYVCLSTNLMSAIAFSFLP